MKNQLIGKWEIKNNIIEPDVTCKRIEYLISESLSKIKSSKDGWFILYQDKKDGRYWELSYPQSEMHGGGPPSLKHIYEIEAIKKYNL